MHIHHKHFHSYLTKTAKKPVYNEAAARYVGSLRPFYPVSVPQLRALAKDWAKANKDLSVKELEATVESLAQGESHQEKYLAGIILEYTKKQRATLSLKKLSKWFLNFEGWAEIDSMAYGKFTAAEVSARWDEWEKLIQTLSKSRHIQQRRASLVLLTKPLSQSADENLRALAFTVIKRLQHEKDILITKAISWLLRSMSKHHAKAVKQYIKENETLLPAIAVRETKRKIETGRK